MGVLIIVTGITLNWAVATVRSQVFLKFGGVSGSGEIWDKAGLG